MVAPHQHSAGTNWRLHNPDKLRRSPAPTGQGDTTPNHLGARPQARDQARQLRKVGLDVMADKAATGFYHDFMSPLATPELQLLIDLKTEMDRRTENKAVVQALIDRHLKGEFDASKEESDAWAASQDGQEAFQELVQSVRK